MRYLCGKIQLVDFTSWEEINLYIEPEDSANIRVDSGVYEGVKLVCFTTL